MPKMFNPNTQGELDVADEEVALYQEQGWEHAKPEESDDDGAGAAGDTTA